MADADEIERILREHKQIEDGPRCTRTAVARRLLVQRDPYAWNRLTAQQQERAPANLIRRIAEGRRKKKKTSGA